MSLYTGDSFFTLSPVGQAGLLAISGAIVLGLVWRVHWATGLRRVIWAAALTWLYVWLVPQVHYEWYRVVIAGLPRQVVVGLPPGPGEIARLILFAGPATLSAHGQGALFWLLIAVAIGGRR